jgi:hypothetical protein
VISWDITGIKDGTYRTDVETASPHSLAGGVDR